MAEGELSTEIPTENAAKASTTDGKPDNVIQFPTTPEPEKGGGILGWLRKFIPSGAPQSKETTDPSPSAVGSKIDREIVGGMPKSGTERTSILADGLEKKALQRLERDGAATTDELKKLSKGLAEEAARAEGPVYESSVVKKHGTDADVDKLPMYAKSPDTNIPMEEDEDQTSPSTGAAPLPVEPNLTPTKTETPTPTPTPDDKAA